MIRESLDPSAKSAVVFFQPNQAFLQYRATTGGSVSTPWIGYSAFPYWVKLVRAGNIFTGSISPDGQNWTQIASTTIAMNAQTYIGLVAAGEGYLETTTFDNVSINSAANPAPAWYSWFLR